MIVFYFRYRIKDKQDRATAEQALDPRTIKFLRKFIQSGLVDKVSLDNSFINLIYFRFNAQINYNLFY